MPWVDIPLAVQAGEGRSGYISDAELTNLMLQPSPPGSPRPFSIVNTPALSTVVGTTSGTADGMLSYGSYLWIITNGKAHYYNGSSVTTLAGTVNNSNPYRMVGVGVNQVVAVNGVGAYLLETTGITTITPPAGTFRDVTYQDGYTIYARNGTDEYYISALDDPTTINALDFSTIDALSDTLVGCMSDHRELVLFGREHIEFWYNSGNAAFPFERSSPGVVERGATNPETIAKWDNAIFFLGDDLRVYRIEGYRPTPISTPWIERLIPGNFNETDFAPTGATYHLDGQAFYSLSFNWGDQTRTLKYNISTGLWHVVLHDAMTSDAAQYISVQNYRVSNSFNRVFALVQTATVGNNGRVYRFDPDTYQDVDSSATDTTRTITCPAIEGDGSRMFCHEVELAMEKVNGGSPGTVTYSYSDDGGVTYTTHSAQSTNQERVRWTRCGSFYRRINRFEFLTNARVAVSHARARIERGSA